MGLESTSWDWLRNGVQRTLPHFSYLERVENGVSAGMADVNYIIRGKEGWIELKAVELPKRESTPVLKYDGLNINQINWHLKRTAVLGRTWVFVSADPFRWLVAGMFAKEINDWTRDELCVHSRFHYDENWRKEQWERFVSILAE